jgi:hypothetical protein
MVQERSVRETREPEDSLKLIHSGETNLFDREKGYFMALKDKRVCVLAAIMNCLVIKLLGTTQKNVTHTYRGYITPHLIVVMLLHGEPSQTTLGDGNLVSFLEPCHLVWLGQFLHFQVQGEHDALGHHIFICASVDNNITHMTLTVASGSKNVVPQLFCRGRLLGSGQNMTDGQ